MLTDGWTYATWVVGAARLVSGPASWLPRPAKDALLHARNVEALNRLAYLAENREHRRIGD